MDSLYIFEYFFFELDSCRHDETHVDSNLLKALARFFLLKIFNIYTRLFSAAKLKVVIF